MLRNSLLTLLVALSVLPRVAPAQESDAVVGEFVARLETALAASAGEQIRLWNPGARDDGAVRLDFRRASLFHWKDPRVTLESAKRVSGETGTEYVLDVLVRGEARWEPRAYGIATAFWSLMTDDENETNQVVRREAWRIAASESGWGAVERVLLAPVEVIEAKLEVGVYPGQGAVLVECAYYLRSLADDVRNLRFLLDRRAEIYDLRVDGTQARVVRGSELGSFGLEGFCPEVESSLRFPEPLAAGEEVLVKFKIRSPLVHLRGDGFVSTIAFREGPFEERAWYPILALPRCAGESGETPSVELGVRWPSGAFESFALSGKTVLSREVREQDLLAEEDRLRSVLQDPRGADFALGVSGTDLASLRWLDPAPTITGAVIHPATPPAGNSLDPDRRSRSALVEPLLSAAIYSSEDLESAIEELLPLEEDLLDIFLDQDADGDAEEGADDRTSG
jgi:hypothetical protein